MQNNRLQIRFKAILLLLLLVLDKIIWFDVVENVLLYTIWLKMYKVLDDV